MKTGNLRSKFPNPPRAVSELLGIFRDAWNTPSTIRELQRQTELIKVDTARIRAQNDLKEKKLALMREKHRQIAFVIELKADRKVVPPEIPARIAEIQQGIEELNVRIAALD